MRNKIVINIAPKVKLHLDLSFLHFRFGWPGLLDILIKLSEIAGMIFLLTCFSWEFFNPNTGLGTVYAIYSGALILITLQLLKKLFGKGDHFPQVSFDIPLLSFTTSIAISLFIATALAHKNINVWGGSTLRSISGVIVIAYWFIYFLINANYGSKKTFQKAIVFFWLAPIVSIFFYLTTFRDFNSVQSSIFVLITPGTLWLILTQKKLRWLHVLNLAISLLFLFQSTDSIAITVVIAVFLVSFLAILITNREQLLTLFQGLDIKQSKRFDIFEYFNDNALVIYMVLSFIIVLSGLFWFPQNYNPYQFSEMVNGIKLLHYSDLPTFLIGNGLQQIAASKFWQFLFVYGAIPSFILLISCLYILKKWTQQIKNLKNPTLFGVILSLITSFLSLSAYLLVANKGTELVIFTLVVVSAFLGSIYNFRKFPDWEKPGSDFIDFKNIKQPNYRMFLKIFRLILASIIFSGCIYLLSSINYISIFVTT